MCSYELQTINKESIPLVFREEAKKIAQKINDASEQVALAKEYAEAANSIELGGIKNLFGGQTKKKTEALGNAAVKTNEALMAMGDLVQESIKLTCRSADAAINMSLAIASIIEEGFEDKDGKIRTLSDEGRKNMNVVKEAAIDFVKKQAFLQQKLDEIDKVDMAQNERLESLQRGFDEECERVNKSLDEKNKVDAEQTKWLEGLQRGLDERTGIDDRQNKWLEGLQRGLDERTGIDDGQNKWLESLQRGFEEKSRIDTEQDERLNCLRRDFDDQRERVRQGFEEKSRIDAEQDERLNDLNRILMEKEQTDEQREKAIQSLIDYTKQKDIQDNEQREYTQKMREELKAVSAHRKIILACSITASAISLGTVVFFIIRVFL